MANSKTATFGTYSVRRDENNKITITKDGQLCNNTMAAIREIAGQCGFELNPGWNTQQSGAKLIAFLEEKNPQATAELEGGTQSNEGRPTAKPKEENYKIDENVVAPAEEGRIVSEDSQNGNENKKERKEESAKLDDYIGVRSDGSCTIKLQEPGSLQQYIIDNAIDMTALKLLTIKGNINKDDIKLLDIIRSSYNQLECHLVLPEGLTEIRENAYYEMESLFEVIIPDSVTSIGTSSFFSCSNLKSVTLSNSLITIGDSAFRRCVRLSRITIPDVVTSIGKEAFSNCEGLTFVALPKSVTEVGEKCYSLCKSLKRFRLLSSTPTKDVGKNVLYYCDALSFVEVPKGSMPFYQISGWKDAKADQQYGRVVTFMEYDPNAESIFKDPFEKNMVTIKADTFKQPINDYHPAWNETFSDKRKKAIFHSSWTGSNAGKPRKVTVSKDYKLCKYPVTQGQWESVMGKNPSHFTGDSNLPVENISSVEIQAFIDRLNGLAGKKYRLPTFAEWQMAALSSCRDEDNCLYKMSEDGGDIKEYAWLGTNSERKTHPVGQLKPNENGLYDMQGNVRELCSGKGEGNITSLNPVSDPNNIYDGRYESPYCQTCGAAYDDAASVVFAIRSIFSCEKKSYVGFRLAISVDE